MKIAIDARAATEKPSGVGLYTRTLVESLARRPLDGDDYYLLSNRPIHLPSMPSESFHLLSERHPVGNLWLQARCPALLREKAVDVFHGTNFLAPLRCSCPVVITVHDLSSFLFPWMHTIRNNAVQRLLPMNIKRADLVIAISQNTKHDLIKHLRVPEKKIRVIPNAPATYFSAKIDKTQLEQTKKSLSLPDRFFLFVGTLEPRKNVVRLLEAYARFQKKDGAKTKLVLVGEDGWGSHEVYRHYRKLGLGDNVRFLGYQDHQLLAEMYRLSRAVIMPSVYEGYGLPAMEAMACGTPVIAANNSGLAEVVGDAALLVKHRDVDQLAEFMHLLDSDDSVHKLYAKKARSRAKAFRTDAFAEATFQVYREAVEENS